MPWIRSLLVLLVFGVASALAADWPQWLGPTRDGASPEKVAAWKGAPRWSGASRSARATARPSSPAAGSILHSKVKDKDEEEVLALDAERRQGGLAQDLRPRRLQEPLRQRPARHARGRRRQALHLRHHRRADLLGRRQGQAALAGRGAQEVRRQEPLLRRLLFAAGRGQDACCSTSAPRGRRSSPSTRTTARSSGSAGRRGQLLVADRLRQGQGAAGRLSDAAAA